MNNNPKSSKIKKIKPKPPDTSKKKVYHSFFKNTRVSSGCLIIAYSLVILNYTPRPFNTILWLLIQIFMSPTETKAEKILWIGGSALLLNMKMYATCIVYMHLLLLQLTGMNYRWLGRRIDYLLFYIDETLLALESGMGVVGINSDGILIKVYSVMLSPIEYLDPKWLLQGLFCYTLANKLRPLAKSEPVLDHTKVAFTSPSDTKIWIEYWQGFQISARIVLMLLSGVLMIPIGLPIYLVPLVYVLHVKVGETQPLHREEYQTNMVDGVYQICYHFMSVPIERAIGVCFNGVFHAPFHATGDTPLMINSTLQSPTYVDPAADIVTWGGPPQFATIHEGEIAYALINRLSGQTTYAIKPEILKRDLTWPKLTVKGESGSPIVVDRDGKLALVALAGNYVNTDTPTEYSVNPKVTVEHRGVESLPQTVNMVTLHPGGGKTFRIIPDLVAECLAKLKNQEQIVVTGPTRVVCKELFDSLTSKHPDVVGMMVKGYPRANRHAKVIVTAHTTLATMILNQEIVVAKAKYYIVDESHTDDVGTEVVKHYCRSKCKDGITSWFLSATHPHSMSSESNHYIHDEMIKEYNIPDKITSLMEEGKRTLLFCPTIEGKMGTRFYQEKFKDHNPIILNSKTYASVKGDLSDLDRKLIITTNIAECGINLDIDAVVDTSKNFYYTYDNGSVEGNMSTITKASWIQRRGRVGRRKAGEYYYVENPSQDYRYDTISQHEALMIARGQSWYDDLDPYPDKLAPTTKQALYSIIEGKGIDYTMLTITRQGRKRTGDDLSESVEEWLSGNVNYRGCRKPSCHNCKGKYSFWDERYHDELCKLAGRDIDPKQTQKWGVW